MAMVGTVMEETIVLHDFMGLAIHPDDSVTRPSYCPLVPANPTFFQGTATRDVILEETSGLQARIFLPQTGKKPTKLPLILYFHGGAFCMFNAASSIYDTFCRKLASELCALIVSVDYRLAPENRLPAAYEDGLKALKWLVVRAKDCGLGSDSWMELYADFSRVFIMGDSAGGNIVFHLFLEALAIDLSPLCLKGEILLQPMFGGMDRLHSEVARATPKPFGIPRTDDLIWGLVLPKGVNRDHPFCNVVTKVELTENLEKLNLPPILLVVGGLDWMYDRQLKIDEVLTVAGKNVTVLDLKEASHGFFVRDGNSSDTREAFLSFKKFVNMQ